jgi:hypothetical protein
MIDKLLFNMTSFSRPSKNYICELYLRAKHGFHPFSAFQGTECLFPILQGQVVGEKVRAVSHAQQEEL